MDKNFPDVIVTYSTLADKIFNYARECAFDTVITPFSGHTATESKRRTLSPSTTIPRPSKPSCMNSKKG